VSDDRRPQRNAPHDLDAKTFVVAALIFYGLTALLGWVILAFSDLDPAAAIFGTADASPPPLSPALGALLGLGVALGVVLVTFLTRRLGVMRRMHEEFAAILGPLSSPAIAALAASSSIGEEILFRGALQPLIGFWPTAIIFGLLHGGGLPRLWAWTAFALGAGVLLGWLADITGSLLAPILCHFTVNYWNLHALSADAARPERGSPPP
jgi:membrane protease YdiL (CAAX protease family)